MSKLTRPQPRLAALATLLFAGGLLALAVVGGCTSDRATPLGADLAETAIDTVLAPLSVAEIADFGNLAVVDARKPFDEAEVLYIGSSPTEQSSILANFNFSAFDHPDSAYLLPFLTLDNVRTAEIRLYRLLWYTAEHDSANVGELKPYPAPGKIFDVHRLEAPFDTLSYPAAEPPYDPAFLSSFVDTLSTSPIMSIDLAVAPIINWIQAREDVGLILREDGRSDPGIIGFASKEMVHGGSTLVSPLNAGTTLGVALRLQLIQTPQSWASDRQYAIFGPSADISTWHELQPPYTDPADGIMVRTHLRSYPMIRFDLSALPPNVRINRANLVMVNDTLRSEGHRTVLTTSEIRPQFVPPGVTTVFLRDLEPEINFMSGNGSWEPEHLTEHELKLNVTSSLQRYVNGAYEGDRGFVVCAGEFFFPGFNANPDPDFWFTKWIFFGTAAAAEQRPRLEISYTRLDELDDPEGSP